MIVSIHLIHTLYVCYVMCLVSMCCIPCVFVLSPSSAARLRVRTYTQFAIKDSHIFGPSPWKILVPPSNYLSTKRFLGNPTLGTNLG